MRITSLFLTVFIFVSCLSAQNTIPVMDSIVFYDGYLDTINKPVRPGVIRLETQLYAKKLTASQLQSVGTTLQMNVVIKALCDNYDRIGNVNLALVPSGASTYDPKTVDRIELGRFITPFMNKNVQPDTVPYTFDISNVCKIMKDSDINSNFDIWIELEVFGVPYTANNGIAGCSSRNDVFLGKVEFVTNSPSSSISTNFLLPLFMKNSFNNYQTGATDVMGKTEKSITFDVPVDLTDASFFLITSNHGASAGGEEYNRRNHYVSYDGNRVLSYKPGRLTCEPFRQFNTQSNGIYRGTPRSNAVWQSFSNWCPGDVIDIRKIDLGPVTAGSHTFSIEVPDAIFKDNKGNFPISLYLQGTTSGTILALNNKELDRSVSIYPNPTNDYFTIKSSMINSEVVITDIHGKQIFTTILNKEHSRIQIDNPGLYFVSIKSSKGVVTKKIVVN